MEEKELNLDAVREEIDGIDRELVSLYVKRMEAVARVAAYKAAHDLPILDSGRERALLSKVAALAGEEHADTAAALYTSVLSLSRAYQARILDKEHSVKKQIETALKNTPPLFPTRAVIACQGVEGAYSQLAADKLFPYSDIFYFSDFEGVFSAIEKGLCRYGVLPIENSTAGSVSKVYDLMMKHHFYIVRTLRLKVDHCLVAKKGVKLSEIREIYSHEQAISQSSAFLREHPEIRGIACENTAVAAKTVAEASRRDVAALASHAAADAYGLSVLLDSVQDTGNNYTRFICISKELEIYPGANRTSMMLTLSHRPGALYHLLSRFYAAGVNLTKLESRPLPDRDFEFMFYFDLDTSVYSPRLAALLADIEGESGSFRYLGTYTENI